MASKVVAVAGGSGKLGRAIVDELIAYGSYKVFILGRKANAEKSQELGAPILAIDYNDVDSLAKILDSNNIDTVVSTIGSFSADPELALISAADKSKVTKRYIPSFWGTRYTPEVASIFPLANIKLSLLSALSTTSLTYTTVVNGLFMDYFGFPHIKSYLGPFPIVLDIAAARAAIPGSGAVPITFTYSFDIGRFVARLLQNPSWDKESVIVGDKVSWNEFLTIAEEVRGLKFDVAHDSMELLKQGKVTELPGHAALYPYLPKEAFQGMAAVFGILMEQGVFDFEKKDVGFKTITARELVEEAWKGK